MEVGDQHHVPAALPPGKRPGTHCTGGWVGPRASLEGCRKSCPPSGFDLSNVRRSNCLSFYAGMEKSTGSIIQLSRAVISFDDVIISLIPEASQFAAPCLPGLWVRIPPRACLSLVSVVCCQAATC